MEPHKFPEQYNSENRSEVPFGFPSGDHLLYFLDDEDKPCFTYRTKRDGLRQIKTSYYVGLGWVGKEVVFVEPKLNTEVHRTDYLAMLMEALQHPEISAHCENLFEIRFDQQEITISKEKDLLTPLILIQYVNVLKRIVQKGLKKSYYPVVRNLNNRVKGKILVGENLRQNVLKHKMLTTTCRFEEFGVNGLENRLLKKALACAIRYLPSLPDFGSMDQISKSSKMNLEQLLAYIQPAFFEVSEEVRPEDLKHSKKNVFYKEYEEALRLARLILKRFGYQIHNSDTDKKYAVPPYWIDMAKLFELYAFARLKDFYPGALIEYHPTAKRQELDFILSCSEGKFVVDAKYKKVYERGYEVADIRQVSGYARLRKIYGLLGEPIPTEDQKQNRPMVLNCLIVYPIRHGENNVAETGKMEEIAGFVRFFKLGLSLPNKKLISHQDESL
jgi:5-methylcytosine-specific restriction enzyme subunit McrC